MPIRVAILTISDRSASGKRPDTSGPGLVTVATENNWVIVQTRIIPDEFDQIKSTLTEWCDCGLIDMVLTTGGTGFSPRDITPEATLSVIDRLAPGLSEAMRYESRKFTPHAVLSRAISGIRKNSLIINLPGNPKAACENLNFIISAIPHAIDLIQNNPESESLHDSHPSIQSLP